MEERELFEILHPQVKEQGSEEEISRVAHLARRCLHLHGRNRPTMKEVAAELEEVRNIRFPYGILGAKVSNGITKERHSDCSIMPDGPSSPDSMTSTSPSW